LTADQYITALEADNMKLRDIINQMMCVAQAVDGVPARHQPVQPEQCGPVDVVERRVLG
jgi:hypothetical protein